MTFCIGIKVQEGLIAIADTRISVGSQTQTASKITIIRDGLDEMVFMTSGLRSVRDKVLTYFEKALDDHKIGFDNLYQAVNILADQLRKVAREDKTLLTEAGLTFNLNCLIGGKLAADKEHKLYMLYPEANWVEITKATPYCILGETTYGKPLLDRVLRYESPLEVALKAGFLAFDVTQSSSTGVGYPMDALILRPGYPIQTNRYLQEDLSGVARQFALNLGQVVEKLPTSWIEPLLGEVETSNVTAISSHEL